MTFETFSHVADIGVRGIGKTIEEAFEEAAKALFNVEVNISKVKPVMKISIKCSANNNEELFVEWLNALLSESGIREIIFSKFEVRISENNGLKLEGFAYGEKLNIKAHEIKEEIKAATYSQLKVYKELKGNNKDKWIAQCIVDV